MYGPWSSCSWMIDWKSFSKCRPWVPVLWVWSTPNAQLTCKRQQLFLRYPTEAVFRLQATVNLTFDPSNNRVHPLIMPNHFEDGAVVLELQIGYHFQIRLIYLSCLHQLRLHSPRPTSVHNILCYQWKCISG